MKITIIRRGNFISIYSLADGFDCESDIIYEGAGAFFDEFAKTCLKQINENINAVNIALLYEDGDVAEVYANARKMSTKLSVIEPSTCPLKDIEKLIRSLFIVSKEFDNLEERHEFEVSE